MPVKHASTKRSGRVQQTDKPGWDGLSGKVSNMVEQAKMLFDSLFTIIWNQAKNIFDKMDHLSGHSSAGYAAVATIKVIAILFMIIVAVECIFHFRSYFWLLCGYLSSLLYFAAAIIVRGATLILASVWAILKHLFDFIWKILMGSIRVAIYYLRPTMLFAFSGATTVLHDLIIIFSRWALNLGIDWRSFSQLFCLYGMVKVVSLWIKHGTRVLCDKISSAVEQVKRQFDAMFTIFSNHARIIQDKLDRFSRHSFAGYAVAAAIKICVMFVVTAFVVKCVWIMLGYLSIISIQILYFSVMFITRGTRMLMNYMSASCENILISFWKTLKGSTITAFRFLKSFPLPSFTVVALILSYVISILQICILCGALIILCSKTWNKYRGKIQQGVSFWIGFCHNVFSTTTPAKTGFYSLLAACKSLARVIQVKIDCLRRHSSAANMIVKAIKIVGILFVVTLTVETVFHFRSYFWLLLRFLTYLLHLAVAYIIRVPSVIWKNLVAILEYVRRANSEIFLVLTKLALEHLTTISSLASNYSSVLNYQTKSISKTTVNLTKSWKGILQVCLLLGVLALVLLWRLRAKAFSRNLLRAAGCESTPYCWQFKEEDSYSWRTFGPSDNEALEELYCDVDNLEVNVNLKDTALSIFMKSASQMSVNYEEMSMNSPSSVQFLLRRCSTPSYVQEPNNKSSTQWVWYWKDNNGWKKYAETIQSSGAKQEKIEAAYLNDERTYSFGSGSHNYILKFCETPMYQMNTDPDLLTKRQVRRRPLFASKSEPQDTNRYLRGKAKDFERTRLEKDCKEYRTVSQRFHETLPEHKASILMVEKIQNDELRERYESKRERIQRKLTLRGHDEIEKFLFHGTASDVVDAICKHNFDHRLRGKNGTQYGEGSYFAVNASYSNNYTESDGKRTRYMFLASVLTGESKLGRRNLRRPPLQDPSNLTSDLYDSCVDDENQPKIYVIFNDEQCYPSYLIKYVLK